MEKITIRNFKKNDFETILSWWNEVKEIGPTIEMLPEESTFILEINNVPKMCVTVYLTNTNYVAYAENFVKAPGLSNKYSKTLVNHIEKFTKDKGFKVLLCLSYKEKLKRRYEKLGYRNTLNNLSSFVKEL